MPLASTLDVQRPVTDRGRLAALESYDVLDTAPEEGFDDIVNLAALACDAPVALVSLVARDRQWFKARVGFPPCETDLNSSVCKFALSEPDLFVIPDLAADPRTAANPLVTGDPRIRFYAGAPLRSPGGQVLGSLCVIDTVPRPDGLNGAQAEHLRGCARQVMSLLELRRALAKLETADERLQMALSASGVVGLWDWMVDTDLLHGDHNFARLYGLDVTRTAAGLTMEEYQEHVVPEDLAPLRASIRDTFDRGADFLVEYRLAIPGQPLRWVECKGRLIAGPEDRPVRFSGTAVDVTARKRSEDAVRASEHQLTIERSLMAAIFQQAPIGISVVGATPQVPTILNTRAEELLGQGLTGGDDRRYKDYGALHADGRPYVPDDYPTIRALRRGETVRNEDMRYRHARTGELRLFEVSSSPVRDASDIIQAAATVFADVTERRQAVAEVRQLAGIVEQSGDFIGVARLDGSVVWVNESGRRLVGLADAERARQTTVRDYFDPAQWPEIAATVFPAVQREGHWRGELNFRHFITGALIPVIYDVIALHDAGGDVTAYATVTRDITEQKQAEERQTILNHELAHRLKNTLSIVSSVASQTLRSVPDRAPVEAFERRIQALATAHDVLLSRSWTSAPLRTVSEDVLGNIARSERITLKGPDVALGPRATMSVSLLLHELATNAAKYGALSTETGHVDMSWSIGNDAARPSPDLLLHWRERGGPPVAAPTRRGFGSRLIRMGLVGTGGVELSYPPSGFEASMRAPLIEVQRA